MSKCEYIKVKEECGRYNQLIRFSKKIDDLTEENASLKQELKSLKDMQGKEKELDEILIGKGYSYEFYRSEAEGYSFEVYCEGGGEIIDLYVQADTKNEAISQALSKLEEGNNG